MAGTHPLETDIARLNAMEQSIIDRFIHRERVARDLSTMPTTAG